MRQSILEELSKMPKAEDFSTTTCDSPPTKLYDNLQSDIYSRIERGPYKKFMKSSDYRKIINLTGLSIPLGEKTFTPTFISPLLTLIQQAKSAEEIKPAVAATTKQSKSILSQMTSFFNFNK